MGASVLIINIPEFETKIMITGLINDSRDPQSILTTIRREFDEATIQFVDLDKTVGHRHILLATYNALKSYSLERMISRSLAVEILLYISAERQITDAFARIGVNTATKRIGIIATSSSDEIFPLIKEHLAKSFDEDCNDELLDEWTEERCERVRETFGLSDKEIATVTRRGDSNQQSIQRLTIEKSALLIVRR
jgi:tRNA threonylcarbamoyladenosine modification (KEOPS) complex Cgi121 subunit